MFSFFTSFDYDFFPINRNRQQPYDDNLCIEPVIALSHKAKLIRLAYDFFFYYRFHCINS